jgi:hypothetical protein
MGLSKAQLREIEGLLDKRDKRKSKDGDAADQLLEAATRILAPEPKAKPKKAKG